FAGRSSCLPISQRGIEQTNGRLPQGELSMKSQLPTSPNRPLTKSHLESSAAPAAKATSRKAAAKPASAAETGAAGAAARRRYEYTLRGAGHHVHAVAEQDRVEVAGVGADVPAWRVLDDSGELLRPLLLQAEGHGVRQEFFKRIGWHAAEAVGIHAVNEFLEAAYRHPGARARHTLGGHVASEQPDDGNAGSNGDGYQQG